jgi:hypothetical protein
VNVSKHDFSHRITFLIFFNSGGLSGGSGSNGLPGFPGPKGYPGEFLSKSIQFIYIRLFILYIGDAGEPGLGGGYSQPGQKGEIGMTEKK